jgi:hypothetical protein
VSVLDRVTAGVALARRRRARVLPGVPGASRRSAGVTMQVWRPPDWPQGGRRMTGAGPGLAAFGEGGGWCDVRGPR